ncbi:hypothetical protein SSPO_003100 [Streptomyces antimycoticus]|uniref:Uncharacterized protein n=1 Tax=Streptomyces antimycoticus TaxID=68175 RepID=A0A499UC14_9ACTN|nr:hypothetical protein SSPO_003100 [Streptomyces antimycoticus]
MEAVTDRDGRGGQYLVGLPSYRDREDGGVEAAECRPRESGEREHGRLRHRTSGVGIGAMAIASTSASVRV